MKVIHFYEKIPSNITSSDSFLDLDLLESFGNYEEHIDFNNIPNMKIDKKQFSDWFSYDEISYWWLIHPTIYAKYNEICNFIDKFLIFLKQNPVEKIILHGNFDKKIIISQICKQNNIVLEIISSKTYSIKNKSKFLKKIFYKKISEKKKKNRIGLFKNLKSNLDFPSQTDVIITSPGIYNRSLTNTVTGKTENSEYILQPFLNILEEHKISSIYFDLDYTFRGDLNPLKTRLQTNSNWFPIELIGIKINKNSKLILNELMDSFSELKTHDLQNKIMYKEISLWIYLENTFNEIFYEPFLPTYIQLIQDLEIFLTYHKPKSIIQIYETGPFAKCFEIIAKKLSIPTIGLQHGIIYENYADYAHTEISLNYKSKKYLIPDLTLVFGEYYKKIMTEKWNYPSKNIEIFKHPSFYNFDNIGSIKKEDLLNHLKIKNSRIIFVPLSFRLGTSTNNPDLLLLNKLYQELDSKFTVIIRPHPGDLKSSSKLKKLYPNSNFIISDVSLFENIILSDIVITTISTVGIDAIPFKKKIIFVSVENKTPEFLKDIQEYAINFNVITKCSLDNLIDQLISFEKASTVIDSKKHLDFINSCFGFDNKTDLLKLMLPNDHRSI